MDGTSQKELSSPCSSTSGIFLPDRYCCLKESDFCFELAGTRMKGRNIHVSELFAWSSSLPVHSETPSQHLIDCGAVALAALRWKINLLKFKSSAAPKYMQHSV